MSGNGTTDLIVCSNWKPAIPVGGEICNGKVFGEFICNYIIGHCESSNADIAEQRACVKREDIFKYANGKGVFGWHISDLKIYDKPKELSDFGVLCPEFSKDSPICEGCRYENTLYNGLEPPEFDCKCDGFKPLTHPPRSWCYLEDKR